MDVKWNDKERNDSEKETKYGVQLILTRVHRELTITGLGVESKGGV